MHNPFNGKVIRYLLPSAAMLGASVLFKRIGLTENQSGFVAQIVSCVGFSSAAILCFRSMNKRCKHEKFLIFYLCLAGFGDLEYGFIAYILKPQLGKIPDFFVLMALLPYTVSIVSLASFSLQESFGRVQKVEKRVLIPVYTILFTLFFVISYKLVLIHQFDVGYSRPWFVRIFSWAYGLFQAGAVAGLITSTIRTFNRQKIIIYSAITTMMCVDLVLRYQDISRVTFGTVFFEYLSLACVALINTALSCLDNLGEDEENVSYLKEFMSLGFLGLALCSAVLWFVSADLMDMSGVFGSTLFVVGWMILWTVFNLVFTGISQLLRRVNELFCSADGNESKYEKLIIKLLEFEDLKVFIRKVLLEKEEANERLKETEKDVLRLNRVDAFVHNSEVLMIAIKYGINLIPRESPYFALAKKSADDLSGMVAKLDRDPLTGLERKTTGNKSFLVDLVENAVSQVKLYLEHQGKVGIVVQIDYKQDMQSIWVRGDYSILAQSFVNFLKNAGESINGAGVVRIEMNHSAKSVVIKISDNGCGMSKDTLADFGKNTPAKKKGKGLGAIDAVKGIIASGGEVTVSSYEDIGTVVDVLLQKEESPKWFASELHIWDKVIVFDDSDHVAEIWSIVLGQDYNDIEIFRCKTLEEFRKIVAELSECGHSFTSLVDYELGATSKENGIDVIEELGRDFCHYLVTSNWYDVHIECQEKNIKVLPKRLIQTVPIRRNCRIKKSSRLVLIDDNAVLQYAFAIEAEQCEIPFLGIRTRDEYETYLKSAHEEDVALVDKNLGWSDGSDVAIKVKESVKSVYMTTGGESNRIALQEMMNPFGIHVRDSKEFPRNIFES